ncbi:hypothetical protein PILCRDRAFT_828579 [Piloderma croceum F 1598]|uniref:Uncharacterized protein n=1 Tax=Piloderma croceum (strain F 1598) TaxID=765440 RepID=A0A0C3AJR2_PILCF|nr:hypothetical protein PILCRDRAFT_828579 [Piloderma croceum F 1598]
MKFTSSLLAIAFAIGRVAATPVNDVPPKNISFTYWGHPQFKGVPINGSVSPGVCISGDFIIRSIKIPVGTCTLFATVGCIGNNYTVVGSDPVIPLPLGNYVFGYSCNF